MNQKNQKTKKVQLLILGAGPGGYAAAFRAADLGLEVLLVDVAEKPGGVCLHRGCIPSKALLHASSLYHQFQHSQTMGIYAKEVSYNLEELRNWKNGIIKQLSTGLATLCKQRKIEYLKARGHFVDEHHLMAHQDETAEDVLIEFDYCILATGSRPIIPPDFLIEDERLFTSTEVLDLKEIPSKFLVIGGGYIGLELGLVYAHLGSEIHLAEMSSQILPAVDSDLSSVLFKKIQKEFKQCYLNTQVLKLNKKEAGIEVYFKSDEKEWSEIYSSVFIALGRKPNSSGLGLKEAGVECDEKKFVKVNLKRQTSNPHIYAIGDLSGDPMLAHKASHEGVVAAENIAGHSSVFEPRTIPAVVYTQPEIAWCGLSEKEAKAKQIEFKVFKFPWAASGRALSMGLKEGMTKILCDAKSEKIIGVGIVGEHAGDLISEAALAIEMGATAYDLAKTIHPHPTLSETLMESAEGILGSCLHIYKG